MVIFSDSVINLFGRTVNILAHWFFIYSAFCIRPSVPAQLLKLNLFLFQIISQPPCVTPIRFEAPEAILLWSFSTNFNFTFDRNLVKRVWSKSLWRCCHSNTTIRSRIAEFCVKLGKSSHLGLIFISFKARQAFWGSSDSLNLLP